MPPKPATSQCDASAFAAFSKRLAALLQQIEALNKTYPESKYHQDAVVQAKQLGKTIKAWHKAVQTDAHSGSNHAHEVADETPPG